MDKRNMKMGNRRTYIGSITPDLAQGTNKIVHPFKVYRPDELMIFLDDKLIRPYEDYHITDKEIILKERLINETRVCVVLK
jgi:hypothetical protein